MASSRQMRRSRGSSPMNTSMASQMSVKKELRSDHKHGAVLSHWEEPPLRTPVPSFEDYKGLERHGVLEHMAPLGTHPGQKVRARMKQHDSTRRAVILKNGEAKTTRDEVDTPEQVPSAATRRAEPYKEDQTAQTQSTREREDENGCSIRATKRVTSAKASPTQVSFPEATPSRTPAAQARLKGIVEAAAQRSKELGKADLGLAIKQVFEESIYDRVMADLLDAVLAKKSTHQQATQFQVYVKAARKQLRNKDDSKHPSRPKSASKSPITAGKYGVTRQSDLPKDPSSAPGLNQPPSTSNHRSSKPQLGEMEASGSPLKDGRPPKRLKRSDSASSDSSLSSLDSEVEDFAPAMVESTLRKATSNTIPSPKSISTISASNAGPRLGTFSTSKHVDPSRRPISLSRQDSENAEDLLAARKRRMNLLQDFRDIIGDDSAIRSSTSPWIKQQRQSTPPIAVLAHRGHQSRLRNGTGQREAIDDDDDDDSLSSAGSSQGDLLVPPPLGASRGATPNQLGRPTKAVKKAARMKMSPLKKRNGTTAGIARAEDADANPMSNGHSDDSQEVSKEDGHVDLCTSCSGNGYLICCDGKECPRAFHLTCVDPPVYNSRDLPAPWLCNVCSRASVSKDNFPRGLFQQLLPGVRKRNPRAFNLPSQLREFFEGVRTGEDGEYEESHDVKQNKARAGYEEVPNNLKLRDSKENAVLCFRCEQSAMGRREIVSCDFCALSYHLDCLDPPLANPPNKKNLSRSRQTWMCPNHVDSELARLSFPFKNSSRTPNRNILQGNFRTHKLRRPKQVNVIDIGLRRGFKNNGLIEVEDEPSDEESEEERERSGVIYRVPAKGLLLDFIDRVKRSNVEAVRNGHMPVKTHTKATETIATAPPSELDKRPFPERKAAMQLVQMTRRDAVLDSDTVQNLINTLTAEAPADVETLVVKSERADMTAQEKRDLQALIALATRRLHGEF